jgi:hypothetical protein
MEGTLKNKLEKNIGIFNAQKAPFYFEKAEMVRDTSLYKRLVNWVVGEFDLYLQNESKDLKVYFPGGWFSIENVKDDDGQCIIKIRVNGKSKVACQKIMNQIEKVYNHVVAFHKEKKESMCLAI